VISKQWKSRNEEVKSEFVEGLEEILGRLIEALVGLVVQGAFFLGKCRGVLAPGRIASEEDDDIAVTVFPAVLDDVVLSRGFDGLDLDAMIVRSV
jgi:hypothetical protein